MSTPTIREFTDEDSYCYGYDMRVFDDCEPLATETEDGRLMMFADRDRLTVLLNDDGGESTEWAWEGPLTAAMGRMMLEGLLRQAAMGPLPLAALGFRQR